MVYVFKFNIIKFFLHSLILAGDGENLYILKFGSLLVLFEWLASFRIYLHFPQPLERRNGVVPVCCASLHFNIYKFSSSPTLLFLFSPFFYFFLFSLFSLFPFEDIFFHWGQFFFGNIFQKELSLMENIC